MNGWSAFDGAVIFETRYRVTLTETVAQRVFNDWERLKLLTPDNRNRAFGFLRTLMNTKGIQFNLGDNPPAELVGLRSFWEFFTLTLVRGTKPDGTIVDVAQDDGLLKELFERFELEIGQVVETCWYDAYSRNQASYAPLAPASSTRPTNLSPEERTDPN